MDVTVTIASWNRADLLERCIRSVLSSEGPVRVEVIVVDNASTDRSVTMVRECFPSVHLISNRDNVGFGRAHNQAIAVATGRYILVLNNDAAVLPDTIAALVKFMDDHLRVGICTCPARPSSCSIWLTGGGMLHFPSVMREAVAGFLELIFPPFGWPGTGVIAALAKWMTGCCRPGAEQSVCWAKGGLLMTRSSMFHEVGEFDQDFFMFYEEIDLCLRAREAGWTIWQTSTTSYIHEGRQSTKLRGDRVQLAAASGYAYYRKHHGLRGAMLWRLQYFLIQHVFVRLRRALGRMFRGVFRVRYSLASE